MLGSNPVRDNRLRRRRAEGKFVVENRLPLSYYDVAFYALKNPIKLSERSDSSIYLEKSHNVTI